MRLNFCSSLLALSMITVEESFASPSLKNIEASTLIDDFAQTTQATTPASPSFFAQTECTANDDETKPLFPDDKPTYKLNDSEIGVAFAKCDREGNGLLDKTDLNYVLARFDILPTPAYTNYLWDKYLPEDAEYLDFQSFKKMIVGISPIVARMVNNAKHS